MCVKDRYSICLIFLSIIYFFFFQLSNYEVVELENLASAELIKTSYIAQSMKPKFHKILLVWSPENIIAPDTIATFLSKCERKVVIREKWNQVPGMIDSPSTFGGVMAAFPSSEKMSNAAKALVVSFK